MALNIGVIGVGGVGGYFGGKLCRLISAQGAKVYFIARGPHLDNIRQHGLRVKTAMEGEWICHPSLATDRIEDLPQLDMCLICVKSYDLSKVVQQLCEKTTESTALIPLLNGIDIYERIRAGIHAGHIYPGCVYIGTHIESPGKIVQRGGSCKILFGNNPEAATILPRPVFDIFNQSDIEYEWSDDISPTLWTKFIFIAGISLVGAARDKTLGRMLESPGLSRQIQTIMREIAALAEKKGIVLPATVVADSYEKASHFAYETQTSFQRDFETEGKPDERDLFCGAILRLGEQLNFETPATRALWEILEQRKLWPVVIG